MRRLPLPVPLRVAAAALCSSLLFACFPKAGTAPGPLSATDLVTAQSRWPESSPESLEKGRQFFLGTCDNCHRYPSLTHYSEESWPRIMARMGKKAELTPEETDLVLRFVLVSRLAAAEDE